MPRGHLPTFRTGEESYKLRRCVKASATYITILNTSPRSSWAWTRQAAKGSE